MRKKEQAMLSVALSLEVEFGFQRSLDDGKEILSETE